ncbi:MAG: acyl-CoA reductase [Gemmatimonadota bacterium]|nr:MAG: acyl-CoA reductase [Gemmatimonadota bacterium]
MADGTALDGYWLPQLAGRALEVRERAFGPAHVAVRVPDLTPRTLRELLQNIRGQARILAQRPLEEIITAIDGVARRIGSGGDPLHRELLGALPGLTGYSQRMIEIGLERMAEGWRAEALRSALAGEFGSVGVLDRFEPKAAGGLERAFGPELTVHVFSGNIPGVAVSSLVRALCVKSGSFGKTAVGEPYLAVCFARALAEDDPELANSLAVTYWPGGSEDLEQVAFSEADAVIVYGSDETISDVSRRVPPATRLLAYPNRVSAALIARSALDRDGTESLARGLALDVVTFDQQGCVSPHIVYVERGGERSPLEFGRLVGAILEEYAVEVPRGVLTPGESTLIHQLRAQAEIRGAEVLASQPGTEWTVIVEERPEFEPSPLNRVIQVRAVDDLTAALRALQRVGRHLQTVAIAAAPERLEELAGRLGSIGATRLAAVGHAAWPTPHWHHDGRFQYLDLVRFVDLEA